MKKFVISAFLLLLPFSAEAGVTLDPSYSRCENCALVPAEVAARAKEMAGECRQVGGKPQPGLTIVHGHLIGGQQFWAHDEASFTCEGAATAFVGSGSHGAPVTIFVGTTDDHAVEAYNASAYGFTLEKEEGYSRIWLRVGGGYCGQKTIESMPKTIFCKRELHWNDATRKLDFGPLSDKRAFMWPKSSDDRASARTEAPQFRSDEKPVRVDSAMHNGSQMLISEWKDGRVEITYEVPRSKLSVDQGTVLFTGKRTGLRYQGTAFTFKDGCAPAPYAVSGTRNDRREAIVLTGLAPTRGHQCEITGRSASSGTPGFSSTLVRWATCKDRSTTTHRRLCLEFIFMSAATTASDAFDLADPYDKFIANFLAGNIESKQAICRASSSSGSASSLLTAKITLGWSRERVIHTGAYHPNNSVHCADVDALDKTSRTALDRAIIDPNELKAVKTARPQDYLANDGNTASLRNFQHSWHFHQKCGSCRGHGRWKCPHCDLAAKTTCSSCCGKKGHWISTPSGPSWCNCGGCWGSGKVPCGWCQMQAYVDCPDCDGTGWFTHVYHGTITRKIATGVHQISPAAVARDISAFGALQTWQNSDTTEPECASAQGSITYSWRATTAYVCRTYVTCGHQFEVRFIGYRGNAPLMPTVLDDLMRAPLGSLLAERDAERFLKASEEYALTRAILEAITETKDSVTEQTRQKFNFAVSAKLVDSLCAATRRAYDRSAGRKG